MTVLDDYYTPYRMYMMTRFLGRTLTGPGMFSERGLAFVKCLFLVWLAFGFCCIIGRPEKEFTVIFFLNVYLALDAFHVGIFKLHNYFWNLTVKRDVVNNNILANAMPYTLQGTSGTAILFMHAVFYPVATTR